MDAVRREITDKVTALSDDELSRYVVVIHDDERVEIINADTDYLIFADLNNRITGKVTEFMDDNEYIYEIVNANSSVGSEIMDTIGITDDDLPVIFSVHGMEIVNIQTCPKDRFDITE